MTKSLFNQNGIKISELVAHLQVKYLDQGRDGEVWLTNTDNAGLTNQAVEASSLGMNDVCFDIRRDEPELNPCIDIYELSTKQSKSFSGLLIAKEIQDKNK